VTCSHLIAVCLRTMCSKVGNKIWVFTCCIEINKVGYIKLWEFNTFNIVLNTGSTKLFWDFSISQSFQRVEYLIRPAIKIHLFVDTNQ
jgi:hypothetical protein